MDQLPAVTIDKTFTIQEIDEMSTDKLIFQIFLDFAEEICDYDNDCLGILYKCVLVFNYIVKNAKNRVKFQTLINTALFGLISIVFGKLKPNHVKNQYDFFWRHINIIIKRAQSDIA